MRRLRDLDQRLDRLTCAGITAVAACGVAIIGAVDYFTGYEVSLSLFYLGPVALATWYGGRRAGIGFAILCSVVWYSADFAAGAEYSNRAIPLWNALVRLGFFFITSLLLSELRKTLLGQQHLARTDGLTGLYTRRAFEERLRHDLTLAQRRKSILSLAYVDVDDFKAVNDNHGHSEGDRVLRAIGGILRASVREADTAARIGGDEFAVVLPDTDRRGAEQVISKITIGIQQTLGAGARPVTCSIGVITFMDPETSPERAIAAADALMYEAKRRNKGAVVHSVLGEAVQQPLAADAPQAARGSTAR
jgi:diguanylate cyclase (GGDEF)-like protein